MTFPRKIGFILIAVAVLATLGNYFQLSLPSLRWFYSFEADPNDVIDTPWLADQGRIIGWSLCGVMGLIGLLLLILGGKFHWNPLTLRKMDRFRSIGRGYTSFCLLIMLLMLALLDQALVGKRALLVKYEGEWSFPAFENRIYSDADFGGEHDDEVDFRKLKQRIKDEDSDGWVLMPPVPWDPNFDSDEVLKRSLPLIDGKIYTANSRKLYSGQAVRFREGDPLLKLSSASIREGLQQGPEMVYNVEGLFVGRRTWLGGELVESTLPENFEVGESGSWIQLIYPPAPPSLGRRHYLGTDSKGWDIMAQLYGGLQVLFKAAALYLVLSYGIGITMGSLMGYFGGRYDLVMQRVMEIMSNVPFLLVVMIISNNIGRDNITLATILMVFCIFSWISVATYLRTATYKEKAREYVSAARVLGASTARVIFREILPNAIATIVTLIPFSVSSVVASLTALDFLGFGLPDSYPSWGRLLSDGVANLTSVWIVSSVFGIMVFVLLLITFVGEAIREAFDPKKFTTYQ